MEIEKHIVDDSLDTRMNLTSFYLDKGAGSKRVGITFMRGGVVSEVGLRAAAVGIKIGWRLHRINGQIVVKTMANKKLGGLFGAAQTHILVFDVDGTIRL